VTEKLVSELQKNYFTLDN